MAKNIEKKQILAKKDLLLRRFNSLKWTREGRIVQFEAESHRSDGKKVVITSEVQEVLTELVDLLHIQTRVAIQSQELEQLILLFDQDISFKKLLDQLADIFLTSYSSHHKDGALVIESSTTLSPLDPNFSKS